MAINAFVDHSLPRETFFLFSSWQFVFFVQNLLFFFFSFFKSVVVLKV